MQKEIFSLDKFNIFQDANFYYFFRALNNGDGRDLENGEITDENGNIVRIRTDLERYGEDEEQENPRYEPGEEVSLEQVFDHIKMHNRKDTNCISLSSNANVAITYGRKNYSDRYVIIRVPKERMDSEVFLAGEYMLSEIERRIDDLVRTLDDSDEKTLEILEKFKQIDSAESEEELAEIIRTRYVAKEEVMVQSARIKKGIIYSDPTARISSYQALNQEQSLEKNRIVAKLTLLERSKLMDPIIAHTADNRLLIQTVGNAFSSLEQIHYGRITQEKIIEVQKELIDILALLQQVPEEIPEIQKVKEELINFVTNNGSIEISENSVLNSQNNLRENISIEEMHKLTGGRIPFGEARDLIRKTFYLSKSRLYARELSKYLRQVLQNNPEYENVFKYIENNGFEIEPDIITRLSNRGHQISESVSLDLDREDEKLIEKIRDLNDEELEDILENGGPSNIQNIITSMQEESLESMPIDEYYAEAIISLINWEELGIEGFSEAQKKDFIKKLTDENVRELYLKLQSAGIDEKDLPTYILNIVTNGEFKAQINSENYIEFLEKNKESLNRRLSITQIEEFLDYYKVENTELVLRDYQEEAVENIDEIFSSKKFASAILPTGSGKSFISLVEMLKYKDAPILYLAPQNEIIEQMKDCILQYVLGKKDSLDRDRDIKEAFPNLKFETYPGLKAKRAQPIKKGKYDFIILDELHRTGAKEWEKEVDEILRNQEESVRVLGITATPSRDVDGRDMAVETAKKLGYTDEEIAKREHIAKELDLQTAIQLGLVVNPKIISFIYKLNENLSELSKRIDELEKGDKRDSLQREYNRIYKRYEETRKHITEAEGISDILRTNLRPGGKYIVFIPVSENEEYEDGNSIGKNLATSKIEEYRKKLEEYLKGTGIKPAFYSMLGDYTDRRNNDELREFERSSSGETKFLIVMNKANEGLHIENLDGMLWFRNIDDDSKILMLQQLGRVIYSENPNSPTKEEDRPIVIDACNNVLKLIRETRRQNIVKSDLLLLEEIVNWCNKHNQNIPDINSSNKKEQRYASILSIIKRKYIRYLTKQDAFDNLDEKRIAEIKEIIEKGSEIDLWERELPEREKEEKAREEEEKGILDFFEVDSIITDLVDMQEKVEIEEEKTAMAKVLAVAEILRNHGVEFKKMQLSKVIDGKQTYLLLKDIQQEGIDMKKIIAETGLDEDYAIGDKINRLRQTYNGTVKYSLTEEERRKAEELGLIPDKEKSAVAKILEIIEILVKNGVNFRGMQLSETENKKTKHLLLKDIKQEGIDIEKIIAENGLKADYKIGEKIGVIRIAYYALAKYAITEEEKRRAEELGLIPDKEKSKVAEALEIAEILVKNGVNFRGMHLSKSVNKKQVYFLIRDIKQEGVDIEKIIAENGLNGEFCMGKGIDTIRRAYYGKTTYAITEEEKKKAEELGLIPSRGKHVISEYLRVIEILKKRGIEFKNLQLSTATSTKGKHRYILLKDIQQEGIDIERISRETGISANHKIGFEIGRIRQAYKGTARYAITEEEKKKAEEWGLIPEEEKTVVTQALEIAETLIKKGVILRGIHLSHSENGKRKYFLVSEINQEGIDIEKIIEETGIKGNYCLGNGIKAIREAYTGSSEYIITEEQRKKAVELGLIPEKTIKLVQAREARDKAKKLNDSIREKEEELDKKEKRNHGE